MNDWKKRWQNREMDQCARQEKRDIKRKKVRDNRRACKRALHDQEYDDLNVTTWKDLDGNEE